MIKAVFFDFNGTLYFDRDINEITWKDTIYKIAGNQIDFDKFFPQFKSTMDYLVIEEAYKLINKPYTNEEIYKWVNYKEESYRKYGIEHKRIMLSPGAEEVLDYLKSKNVPVILCTSSIIENVEYYYKYFNLDKWFIKSQTVYDTGEYNSKAQMYQECARRLNTKLDEGIVIEDSVKSIKEAIAGGANKIIAIKREDIPNLPEIKQIVNNLSEIDYSIFD